VVVLVKPAMQGVWAVEQLASPEKDGGLHWQVVPSHGIRTACQISCLVSHCQRQSSSQGPSVVVVQGFGVVLVVLATWCS